MKILNKLNSEKWCYENNFHFPINKKIDFSESVKMSISMDSGKKVALSKNLVCSGLLPRSFLIYISNSEIFPSCSNFDIFNGYRNNLGISSDLYEYPGLLFETSSDHDVFIAHLTIAILFYWDLYLIIPDKKLVLFFSHDGIVFINGSDHTLVTEWINYLAQYS